MVSVHNVAEAKAQLSRLLDAALAGEEVILARAGRPLVRLVPLQPPPSREIGFLPLTMPDDRFDPLEGDDLERWS
ncbi:MAG TPA: type II toxin-antitoxin system prevent-host-death family antitoxin [Egibacteraceae bacterium]|jgi:prevent-host-death family protein|nr:type II toxin-antitoxin system prevent-host-death family antitoxin [Egibacteraceae bacterium]